MSTCELRRLVLAGGILLAGVLGSSGFAATVPTFSGYHWPTHLDRTYQANFRVMIQVAATLPKVSNGTVTMQWQPQIAFSTGQRTAQGILMTLRYAKAPLTVKWRAPNTNARIQSVQVGPLFVKGIFQSDGDLRVTRSDFSKMTQPIDSYLKPFLPTNKVPILPRVPKVGWTAGRGFLAPYTVPPMPMAGMHFSTVKTSYSHVGEWIVPKVGHHHWQVDITAHMTHPVEVTGTLTNGSSTMRVHETIGTRVSGRYYLNGQLGGLLKGQAGSGSWTARVVGTSPTSNGTTPILAETIHMTVHNVIRPLRPKV